MAKHFTLPGRIYFAVIGPGPAKRLTLRTLELLRKADLIVHDDLVPDDVLELIAPHVAVQKIATDLASGRHSFEDVRRRMVEAAKNGQCVVRLMFGGSLSEPETQREITNLHQAGIEAEFLAGTLSAAAAAEGSKGSFVSMTNELAS